MNNKDFNELLTCLADMLDDAERKITPEQRKMLVYLIQLHLTFP
jgi:hypothetical protein